MNPACAALFLPLLRGGGHLLGVHWQDEALSGESWTDGTRIGKNSWFCAVIARNSGGNVLYFTPTPLRWRHGSRSRRNAGPFAGGMCVCALGSAGRCAGVDTDLCNVRAAVSISQMQM